MGLLNGLFFGVGTGLMSAGTLGLANEHTAVVFTLGLILTCAEVARILCQA